LIYIQQTIEEFSFTNIIPLAEEYIPTTEYSLSELVRVGNYQYKSTHDSNTGNDPLITLGVHWTVYAPANEYALLDLIGETRTDWTGNGIVEFVRGGKTQLGIGNFKATEARIDYLDKVSGVVNGLTIATSANLNSTVLAGTVYVNFLRFDIQDTAKLFTASKDTYVDMDETGTVIYTEVVNGATAPTLTSPNERIAKVVTSATAVTSVTDLRTIVDPILETVIYPYSINAGVNSVWTYGYTGFSDSVDRVVYMPLKKIGTNIRVSFIDLNARNTYCGFMIAGLVVDMGATVDKVSFTDRTYGTRLASVATFSTAVNNYQLVRKISIAKKLKGQTMLFVIDPSADSVFENMAILGKINKADGTGEVSTKNFISWEIEQTILE
jgi:hypothetical protein